MKRILFIIFVFVLSVCPCIGSTNWFIQDICTENMPVADFESQENTEYWLTIFNIIKKAQETNCDKVVIKYDGKWKYVIPSVDAIVQVDIIMSHFCSGTSIDDGSFEYNMVQSIECCKKNKLIVTIM